MKLVPDGGSFSVISKFHVAVPLSSRVTISVFSVRARRSSLIHEVDPTPVWTSCTGRTARYPTDQVLLIAMAPAVALTAASVTNT